MGAYQKLESWLRLAEDKALGYFEKLGRVVFAAARGDFFLESIGEPLSSSRTFLIAGVAFSAATLLLLLATLGIAVIPGPELIGHAADAGKDGGAQVPKDVEGQVLNALWFSDALRSEDGARWAWSLLIPFILGLSLVYLIVVVVERMATRRAKATRPGAFLDATGGALGLTGVVAVSLCLLLWMSSISVDAWQWRAWISNYAWPVVLLYLAAPGVVLMVGVLRLYASR